MGTVVKKVPFAAGTVIALKLFAPGALGTIVNGASGDNATVASGGLLSWTVAETLTGLHWAEMYNGSAYVGDGWVNMDYSTAEIDNPDQLNGTIVDDLISSLSGYSVTIASTVDSNGSIDIVTGDTYGAATGRYLNFTVNGSLPDLTGKTIRFTARHKSVANLTISGTGELVSQTASAAVIRVSITATETAYGRTAPGKSTWVYDVEADLGSGAKYTLVGPEAPARILLDQTRA